jgi:NADPH:quinone reductase-like Zn-dependent oxidoreductase
MKAWEIQGDGGIDALALVERETPRPGPGEVLVRLRASSLNFRDLSTVLDPLGRGLKLPLVPNSDAAGEVVEIGAGVTRFKPGDRVIGLFFQRWTAGGISAEAMASALGGALDGVLCECAVLREEGLAALPDHLSFEEGATLPCAALTAWHALVTKGGVKAASRSSRCSSPSCTARGPSSPRAAMRSWNGRAGWVLTRRSTTARTRTGLWPCAS